jgi:hypothetical protein
LFNLKVKIMALTGNPEALHDVCQDTGKKVGDGFVNPGTPASPLVTREQMTQATIKGSGADVLKANIIK